MTDDRRAEQTARESEDRRASQLGYLACGTAAVLWAFGGVFARTLIDRGVSVRELTEARAWIAALVLGVIVYVRKERPTGRVHVAGLVLFGLAIAAANFFYYSAIGALPVAIAIIIQYTAPALVVLWLAVVDRTAPSRAVLLSLALALVGVALLAEVPSVIARGSSSLSLRGILAAATSAVAFAVYMVAGEHVRRSFGPFDALFRGFLVAGMFWLVVQAPQGLPRTIMRAEMLPGVLAIAVGATIMPFVLFVWGLGHIGASRAGIASTLEPLSAALIAALWLDQSLTAVQYVGAAFVVAGVVVVQIERRTLRTVPLE